MKERIARALSGLDLNYGLERDFVRDQAQQGAAWDRTGVLVLLSPWEDLQAKSHNWSFILNKRSQNVPQPGDLCFPGGHPSPRMDRFIARVLIPHVLPLGRSQGISLAQKREPYLFQAMTFFLAGALRECWEEMRVSPFSLDFLGPLPCYRMLTRKKIIFPFAASLRGRIRPKTGAEIEKNLLVPLSSFLDPNNYGMVTWSMTGKWRKIYPVDSADFPCFLARDKESEEILWGATFHICLSFLQAVFGFVPPQDGPVRVSAPLYPAEADKNSS